MPDAVIATSSLFSPYTITQLGEAGPPAKKAALVAGTTPAAVESTSVGTIHKALIAAPAEALNAMPVETRVALVDKLLRGMAVSFDDQAAITKLVVAQPKEMVLALHAAGLLKRVLIDVKNHSSRFGILGLRLGRDFPSNSIQDIRHWDRMKAAITNTNDEDVARTIDKVSHGWTELQEMATAIRGGERTINRVEIAEPG